MSRSRQWVRHPCSEPRDVRPSPAAIFFVPHWQPVGEVACNTVDGIPDVFFAEGGNLTPATMCRWVILPCNGDINGQGWPASFEVAEARLGPSPASDMSSDQSISDRSDRNPRHADQARGVAGELLQL